jgi:hypothetical protein
VPPLLTAPSKIFVSAVPGFHGAGALFAGSRHYRHTKNPAKSLILALPRPITPQNNESKALFYWASCISKNTFHASFHE